MLKWDQTMKLIHETLDNRTHRAFMALADHVKDLEARLQQEIAARHATETKMNGQQAGKKK